VPPSAAKLAGPLEPAPAAARRPGTPHRPDRRRDPTRHVCGYSRRLLDTPPGRAPRNAPNDLVCCSVHNPTVAGYTPSVAALSTSRAIHKRRGPTPAESSGVARAPATRGERCRVAEDWKGSVEVCQIGVSAMICAALVLRLVSIRDDRLVVRCASSCGWL
jgi:hypothetical protein